MSPRLALLVAFFGVTLGSYAWAEESEAGSNLSWLDDLDKAAALAASEYRPILAVFTSSNCGWCRKLKEETFADASLRSLLGEYVLAEIDVDENPPVAMRYRVRGTPTTLILGSDGVPQDAFGGFAKVADVRKRLNLALNRQSDAFSAESQEWLQKIQAGGLNQAQWASLLVGLGQQEEKGALVRAMLESDPLPKATWVNLLAHPNLAVRAGMLDVLEQVSGETFDFDPWQDDPITNAEALMRWRQWAGSSPSTPVQAVTLKNEEIRSILADLVSEDATRSARARVMLGQAGEEWLPVVEEVWTESRELPPGSRRRLREAKYYLMLVSRPVGDTPRLTQGLVYGNLDRKMQALTALIPYGKAALPIYLEYMKSPHAVVRETAIDGLIRAGQRQAMDVVAQHLEAELDTNVTFVALRALGEVNSRKGLELLTSYLDHPDEDLVIAALQSIARLESKEPVEDIGACLQDKRWRVRAAALEVASKLRLKSLEQEVVALLRDPDEFVRTQAVRTVAEMQLQSAHQHLADAYFEDDAVKAAVVDAFASLDQTLPQGVRQDLKAQSAEMQLRALQALQNHSDADVTLAYDLVGSDRPDVRLGAIRLLAAAGMSRPRGREEVLNVLREGEKAEQIAALEALRVDKEDLLGENVRPSLGWADRMLTGPAPKPQAATPGQPSSRSVLEAFQAASGKEEEQTNASNDARAVLKELARQASAGSSDRIRLAAAKALTGLGSSASLAYLQEHIGSLPEQERRYFVYKLEEVPIDKLRPLLLRLLRDSSSPVRKRAVEQLLRSADQESIDLIFTELTSESGQLQPREVYTHRLSSVSNHPEKSPRFREWLLEILNSEHLSPATHRLALAILPMVWQAGDEAVLEPYLDSDDVWTRREALRTLGLGHRPGFEERLVSVLKDANSSIREVVLRVYAPRDIEEWQHYIDPNHPTREYTHLIRSRNYHQMRPPKLTAEAKEALEELAQDQAAKVRFQAMFILLALDEPVEAEKFIAAAAQIPDQKTIGRRIANFLTQNYRRLGPEFEPLTQYLTYGWQSDQEKENVRRFLGTSQEGDAEEADTELLTQLANVNREPRYEPPVNQAEPEAAETIRLVYFKSAGCRDCELVTRQLKELKTSFPAIEVEEHDIRDISSMRFNEALSSRFGVPHQSRQVTPAVFAGGGYLIKDDVNLRNLGDLIRQSKTSPLDVWHTVDSPSMAQAETAISERFQSFTLGVVLGAGVLDGLNPCAFATIIFFLSYLQMSRRPQFQIAQVGAAFVLAVFLAYFILGLGLIEIVAQIQAFRVMGLILNYAVAAVAFVIMIISIRDGILCLQGRLKDINLQLPGFLKERIRKVSRTGARHSHFVIAAFVSGAIISVLELACTGQVYLPTIMYMVKSGEHRWDAIFYLFLYNLAFITPLVIIFLAATFGLRHDALIRWQQRHTATVKFATAGLFLVLFSFLVVGNSLWTNPL